MVALCLGLVSWLICVDACVWFSGCSLMLVDLVSFVVCLLCLFVGCLRVFTFAFV